METIQGRCSDPKIKLPQGWIVQYSQTLWHQIIFDRPRFPCLMFKLEKKAANLSISRPLSGQRVTCNTWKTIYKIRGKTVFTTNCRSTKFKFKKWDWVGMMSHEHGPILEERGMKDCRCTASMRELISSGGRQQSTSVTGGTSNPNQVRENFKGWKSEKSSKPQKSLSGVM